MSDESAVRERAYFLWEKDACPENASRFYWKLAENQLAAEARNISGVGCEFQFSSSENDKSVLQSEPQDSGIALYLTGGKNKLNVLDFKSVVTFDFSRLRKRSACE